MSQIVTIVSIEFRDLPRFLQAMYPAKEQALYIEQANHPGESTPRFCITTIGGVKESWKRINTEWTLFNPNK